VDGLLEPAHALKLPGISVRYLYLLFQAEGTAPAHGILERRLKQASRLLADPRQAGRTITDIAFSVGFKDASHFTRAFKSRHGLGLREYRRHHRPEGPADRLARPGSADRRGWDG
jgi:AraC-like DNA-binding protein